MKRSNIVLMSIGILSLTLIGAIPVMYRIELSGMEQKRAGYSRLVFNEAKFVKIVGTRNVTVVPADSLAVEFKETDVLATESGDTLFVTAKSPVIIFTGKRPVIAIGSEVLVKGDLKRLDPFSLSIDLRNSHLFSLPVSKDSKVSQQLEDFVIDGHGTSVVDLNGRFDIGHLYLSNVKEFNCSGEVGLRETDFSFDRNANVKTMTCREGMNIVVR